MSDDMHAAGTTRRELLKRAGIAATAAAGVPLWARPAGAFPRLTQRPIKIGFWAPLTGGLSIGGLEAKKGFDLYLEKIRGRIMNRPVQVIYEDDAGNPARSLRLVAIAVRRTSPRPRRCKPLRWRCPATPSPSNPSLIMRSAPLITPRSRDRPDRAR